MENCKNMNCTEKRTKFYLLTSKELHQREDVITAITLFPSTDRQTYAFDKEQVSNESSK